MAWTVEWDKRAFKELAKLDRRIQHRILQFLQDRASEDPTRLGQSLAGIWAGLWRYRVGDYRIICDLEEDRLVILVVRVGHRSDVYD